MSLAPDSEPVIGTIEIETLVQRTLAGDSRAFESIVRRFERRVLTLASRLLGDTQAAEDAAQESFLRAFKYLHRLDLEKPIEPWLIQIVVNVCRDMARKKHQQKAVFSEAPVLGEWDKEPQDKSPDPQDGLVSAERRRAVRQAIDFLPEKERLALLLRDVEGLSTAEVAETLGSSETTVRSQICRGRLRLKDAIERVLGGTMGGTNR